MVHMSVTQESDMDNMKLLYKTALLIRQTIVNFKKKEQSGMVTVLSKAEDVPPELYSLIRWILVGPEEELKTRDQEQDSGPISPDIKPEHHVCFQNQKAGATPTQAGDRHFPDTARQGKSTGAGFGTYHSS